MLIGNIGLNYERQISIILRFGAMGASNQHYFKVWYDASVESVLF